jgi:GNAT superfamily N-acetyltransferase
VSIGGSRTPFQYASDAGVVTVVTEADLDDCVSPSDECLFDLSRALLEDHVRDGVQLIARGSDSAAIGFATLFWSWSTLSAGRIGVMNDLFVLPEARGTGVADALITACVRYCQAHGDIARLTWQTARDNRRAQAVYERVGAKRSEWIDYAIDLTPGPAAIVSPLDSPK